MMRETFRRSRCSPRSYAARNDTTKRLDVLASLAAADPTNIRLIQDVVAEFAIMKRADKAIPLVRDLLQNNPGDPQLLNLAWKVYLNAADYQGAIDIGNEMVRVDTAAATADYYARTAAAYAALNLPQKSAEAAAMGVRKFPNDPNLALANAQTLFKSGQLHTGAGRSEESQWPRIRRTRLVTSCRRRFRHALKQWDDVVDTLNQAKTNGIDPMALSQIALQQGSNAYKDGTGIEGPRGFPARHQVPPAFRRASNLGGRQVPARRQRVFGWPERDDRGQRQAEL